MPVNYTYKVIDLGTSTAAYDINNLGQIVGYYTDTKSHAFIYSISDATYTAINDPSGFNGTDGYGINDSGQIVGDYADGFLNHAFLYAGGTSYPTLSGRFAWDINNAGQIVGDYAQYSNPTGTAFIRSADGGYIDIRYSGSILTSAQGINDNGEVVGYFQDGTGYHGFTYLNGGYGVVPDAASKLADAAPNQTFATGVNDSGWIVGYYYDNNGAAHSFLDINGTFQVIGNELHATGVFAQGINDAGQIVGYYLDNSGSHAFFATVSTNRPPAIDLVHSVVTGTINERPGVTGSLALDIANGAIAFTDADLSDRPTASVVHQTVTYQDALGHVFQLPDDHLFRFENAFLFAPESGNTNNGKIDWGFTIEDSKFDFLGLGETIRATSTVEIDDGHGGKVDQDVTVTINGADDLPKAAPDFASVRKGGTVAGNVLANDTDPDIHDILHVSALNGLDFNVGQPIHGNFGTLTLNVDGSYAYTANNNLGSAASRTPVDTFAYTVDDGHGGSSTATLNISITVDNRPTSVNNTVKLTDGLVAVEMIKLAMDAYPFGDTGYHPFDPFGTPLSVTNPTAVSDMQADNWHFISASELHLNPSALHGPHSIQYSFNNGFYQATRAGDSLNNDPSEADAIVVTGIVNGQRTLAIAFAGTDQKSDWIDFANFSDHYGKFSPLVAAIKQYIDSGAVDQVLVSGHSLGGAMAQDFMEDPIFKNDPHFHALAWTIGSPGSDNISQDTPDSRITNFYHTLDPIYELTHPLSLTAEFVRSSGSFVQQQNFKGLFQDFLVNSPYGFSSSEAGIVANNLLNKMIVKAHEGTDIEIPFGQPATHVINILGTHVDFDAHDQTAYFHDVEAYLTGLSSNSSDFLLHI